MPKCSPLPNRLDIRHQQGELFSSVNTEFAVYPGSMSLNRTFRKRKLICDLLIGLAIKKISQYVEFACRKKSQPFTHAFSAGDTRTAQKITMNSCSDRLQKYFIVHGFNKKVDRSPLETRNRHINIGMPRQKDGGQHQTSTKHFVLEFESRHQRHTHVKNKTPGTPDVILNEKGSCVRISFCRLPFNTQH